jgi:hypothetical protein
MMRRFLTAALTAGALVVATTIAAAAQVPAFNPEAVEASGDAACYGQLVAFAAHPHEGFAGNGLAHDAPGHGFATTAELQAWLRSFCS